MSKVEHCSRRGFLKGCLAAPLVGGCASLAPAGEHDPSLAVLLSDLHIDGTTPSHTHAELARTVADILALRPLPARAILFGDIANTHGRACDYAAAKPLLAPLAKAGLQLDWMMGNHDHRAAFNAWQASYAASSRVPGRLVHVVALPHFDLVLLDSLDESPGVGTFNEINGKVDKSQLAFLQDFGRQARRPFLVCAHHDGRQMKSFAKAAMSSSPLMCGYLHGHRHSWMPDALHVWTPKARLVRSVGLPSAAAWGDVGFALLRDEGTRVVVRAAIRDCWFPTPPATAITRQIARENDGAEIIFQPER